MKRVKAACVCQTLRFSLKEEMDYASAIKLVREEVAHYRKNMDRSGTQYRILEETEQPDGSILVKVIKQYNACPVGEYLKATPHNSARKLSERFCASSKFQKRGNTVCISRF